MRDLPAEVFMDIFARLSPKDLVRSTCVSKEGKATIEDPQLAKSHLQRSIKTKSHPTILIISPNPIVNCFSLNFSDTDTTYGKRLIIEQPWQHPPRLTCDKIFGYFNGLVCMHDGAGFGLWNPSIQKFKRIHSSPFSMFRFAKIHGGFGYDSVNVDYKLVSFVHLNTFCAVHSYSLKSGAWKSIQDLPLKGLVFDSQGVFLQRALHWLTLQETDGERMLNILTFDLASEEFCKFPLPVHIFPAPISDQVCRWPIYSLVVVGGYLCIYLTESRCKAWIMREYGVVESWSMLYSFDEQVHNCKPLLLSSCGKMVLLEENYSRLVWYDLHNGTRKMFQSPMAQSFSTIICEESIHLLGS
ncbi:PREDICTED: F-box [Prunus dulcis]|uniref:PREDICTED: F-box n=1 Tax=Prunus dulcis TaxID=3755 RepID=A0A5E4EVW4_PRUDU|nr:PREDICTED: F-box [Prunus dulcis]